MIYEYRCDDCGEVTEKWANISELDHLSVSCNFCGGETHRKYSALNYRMNNRPRDFGKGVNPKEEQRQSLYMKECEGKLTRKDKIEGQKVLNG